MSICRIIRDRGLREVLSPVEVCELKEKRQRAHRGRMAAGVAGWKEQGPAFYLNYWMFSVHAPFDAKRANIEKHRARVNPTDPQRSPTYAAMIESMDDAIGTLLDALDRLQVADNTIIIFTADNGGNMYNEVDGTTPTSNAPLRGGKATMFEGGTRVPAVIVWPGLAAPGSRCDAIVQSEDYYPTLLAGLGLSPQPAGNSTGASILPGSAGEALWQNHFAVSRTAQACPDWLPPAVSVHRGRLEADPHFPRRRKRGPSLLRC
jgi:membrane-anchored protein YejM (alkaline phosphatase superfamily)